MKFYIGALTFDIDLTQMLNGNGFGLHINGQIRPDMKLAVEVNYIPVSTEKLSIVVKVNESEVIS